MGPDTNQPNGNPTSGPVPTGTLRPYTFGERAVGLSFNPGGDPKVNEVKELYAKIIDILHPLEQEATEKGRMVDHAVRLAQSAQMWAVKVITWK